MNFETCLFACAQASVTARLPVWVSWAASKLPRVALWTSDVVEATAGARHRLADAVRQVQAKGL
jgi:hypothetical protein